MEYYDILIKTIKHENSKIFLNYTNSSCTIFNQKALILQNTPIPPTLPNYILSTHFSTKCFNTFILYTTDAHFYNSSIKDYFHFSFPIFWQALIPQSFWISRYCHYFFTYNFHKFFTYIFFKFFASFKLNMFDK